MGPGRAPELETDLTLKLVGILLVAISRVGIEAGGIQPSPEEL